MGHLGDLSPLQLVGALAGVEMGLQLAGVLPDVGGGVADAMAVLIKDGCGMIDGIGSVSGLRWVFVAACVALFSGLFARCLWPTPVEVRPCGRAGVFVCTLCRRVRETC